MPKPQTRRIKRSERLDNPDAVARARAYLEDYQRATDMLTLLQNEQSDHNDIPGARFSASLQQRSQQQQFWDARAREICGMIDDLPPYREKMMLHYHYILGYTVEAIAEVMDTSRSGAFRLKKRALELVAAALEKRCPLAAE